ncbi:hypothetical protein ES703_57744 [subsurface metagenome]
MGDIIEQKRRYYSGVEADMASIPAGGRAVGDQFFATDTKLLYQYDGTNWNLAGAGFGRYVPRAATGWDFIENDGIVDDGNWKVDGLDCSAIVPAGAVAIEFAMLLKDNAASSVFNMRANATTKEYNQIKTLTQVANIEVNAYVVLMCDADRLLDYVVTNDVINARLVITGWYI